MRGVALRILPLAPAQYWRLTPAELAEMLEGAYWRREQEWELGAWVTAHLMNVSGKSVKKKIKPDDLLGRKRPTQSDAAREVIRRQQAMNEGVVPPL